ncbi:MAG: GNAT family N-acetyltransferase [Alphaproteobacteria bacterium]|nr:GNAT family N-acetyltransferase [Alphaproteobacteria bacterium]
MNDQKPQESPVYISPAKGDKAVGEFWNVLEQAGLIHDREYYERCLERQERGEMEVLLACLKDQGTVTGFCLLNWRPKYAYFQKSGIPEIQDLNVLRDYRRQGVGRAVIEYCEETARKKGCREMGIGVGLDSRFGAAQRLYARMGYIPDGSGISYDRKQLACGDFRPIDENLCLMMTKALF